MRMKCKNCDHALRPEWEWAWVAHAIKGSNVKTLERMCYGCLIPKSDKWEAYTAIVQRNITVSRMDGQEYPTRELYLVQD